MRDIVSREAATNLKTLGFNEPCFGYYLGDELIVEKYFCNTENLNSVFSGWTTTELKISAPTYSQAFRFFRKNGWYYDISKIDGLWEYYVQHALYSWIEDGFDCDDECEEKCLDRIIDLELVRTNIDPNRLDDFKIKN
jgi:hypothetical protein